MVFANLGGAVVVFALAAGVLPEGPLTDPGRVRTLNIVSFGLYLLVAVPIGLLWGGRRFRLRPAEADAEQRRERRMVLYGPLRLVTVQAVLWALAATVFVQLNLPYSVRLATSVGETIVLGGITTCALAYLLNERILRRTAARVLRWELGDATVLRGRSTPTRLASPREHARPERDEAATVSAR